MNQWLFVYVNELHWSESWLFMYELHWSESWLFMYELRWGESCSGCVLHV